MTPLRQKMIDAMVLRGLAVRTRETYLACVCKLAQHYRCSPDTLSVEQLQAYLLYLIQERQLAYPSVNQAACAFRFLFGEVLKQRAIWLEIPMAKVPTRLPVILTRPEIVRLFDACDSPRSQSRSSSVKATTSPARKPKRASNSNIAQLRRPTAVSRTQ